MFFFEEFHGNPAEVGLQLAIDAGFGMLASVTLIQALEIDEVSFYVLPKGWTGATVARDSRS